LCTKIENKKYIKKVRKEMLNEESIHCVESLNDTKQNSLIDVHDNVHLFSKCDSKGKKRKKWTEAINTFLGHIIQRHEKIHSKFIMEQLAQKFPTFCVSKPQLTRYIRLLKNKMKSTTQSLVQDNDSIIHSKLNKLKYGNDVHVLEYLAKIMDTPKHACFSLAGFGFDVKLVMHQFLLFNCYQ
jgi:hypothetical protein